MSMFVIPGVEDAQQIPVIEFGDGTSVLFTLPVLGAPGVPVAVTSAATVIMQALSVIGPERDAEAARAWGFFVDTIATHYPTAVRHLGSFDRDQLKHVLDHWFAKSAELGNFDPKAQSSLPS